MRDGLWVAVMAGALLAAIMLCPRKYKDVDEIHVDRQHEVICITRWGNLQGCMDIKGNRVANLHMEHIK